MEDNKSYNTSTELVPQLSPYLRPRHVPDVPEDVDYIMEHLNDPNFDLKKTPMQSSDSLELQKKRLENMYASSDIDAESQYGSDRYSTSRAESRNSTAIEFDDESPYPEVRAAVASIDDPSMPVNTFRMWFLGILFSAVITGLNMVFSLRFPSVYITGIVAQLASLPAGKLFEHILPAYQFRTFGLTWSLNPGPFTIKEHVCITVMSNVVVQGAFATDVIATQKFFYHQQLPYSYEILLVLGTQILGFSLAGMLRQFVVWPSSMIWPGALVNSALFNTLHKNYGKRERGHMTRERFFFIVVICSFLYMWLPGYLFTALSVFNWVCWIAPNNIVVNALFGTNTGLGMGILTFDWSMISYVGSPLVTPWWSEMNTSAAFVVCFWFIAPIIYFTNTFNTGYLPMSAPVAFDNTGAEYNATAIVTNGIFDVEKYRSYSPLFVTATLAVAYGTSFAAFPSVFVHTFLWFRRDIVRRFRSSLKDERDVHSRLMQAYPEVPIWWYVIMGVVSFIFTIVAIEIFPTQLPIWAAFLAFIFAGVLCLPLAMLQAITNQQVPLATIHELIIGYVLPGRPIANVIYKTIAYIGTNQAISFAGDLKLGHYMKIPPRVMFSIQVVAATISCFVVTGVQNWMFANIEDICTPQQANRFTCPSIRTFATASLVWGGVGPARMFSPGQLLNPITWFFAVGALAPIPFYILARRYPLSFWRYINIPVCFAGVGAMPPATGINYASWAIAGFTFNYFIRRFHFRWWMRFNYILSAGLDAGVVFGLIVIFFCVQYPNGGFELNWWGNTVWQKTADANGTPFLPIPEIGFFGPQTWS